MATWTFVRHGQSVANAEGWLAGHYDARLTSLGVQQAVAARRELVEPLPARAFCSDLSRAHDTARVLLGERSIPLFVTPRLRERDCGAWERRTVVEIAAQPDHLACLRSWQGRPPSGESLLDVALRAVGWLATIDEGSNDGSVDTLVVAHGALIRSVLAALDRRPRDQIDPSRPNNCELIRREVSVKTWHELLDDLRREASLGPRAHAR